MKQFRYFAAGGAFLLAFGLMLEGDAAKITALITGKTAFSDAKDIKVGSFRKITPTDLPKPGETPSSANMKAVPRPEGAMPQVAAGFKVELYAHDNLKGPRQIRRAPNGDLFVAQEQAGQLLVIRDNNGKAEISVFASGLPAPFGINFYPVGDNPQWVYRSVAERRSRLVQLSGQSNATPEIRRRLCPLRRLQASSRIHPVSPSR